MSVRGIAAPGDAAGTGAPYEATGEGPVVVLVHASASSRRQWRALTALLQNRFRVVAVDLIGYGGRAAWRSTRPQRVEDQAAVIGDVAREVGEPIAVVGHSFGGSVALCAAAHADAQLAGLVLLEPNPFTLLDPASEAYAEVLTLRDAVRSAGARGAWAEAAETFADYWNGPGTWAAMPAGRRAAFAAALPPNVHEWDAVMTAPASTWVDEVGAATSVITALDTVAPIREIAAKLAARRPDWHFSHIEEGGHMAPVTRSDLVGPLVAASLDEIVTGLRDRGGIS